MSKARHMMAAALLLLGLGICGRMDMQAELKAQSGDMDAELASYASTTEGIGK